MVDIARSADVKKKKKIRRILYGVVALAGHYPDLRRGVPPQAGGAVGRSRDGLDRHRQARADAAAGSRLGHAGARRNPMDSRDDAGPCRTHLAASGRDGSSRHGYPRIDQSRSRESVKEAQLAYQSAQAAYVNRKAELESALAQPAERRREHPGGIHQGSA